MDVLTKTSICSELRGSGLDEISALFEKQKVRVNTESSGNDVVCSGESMGNSEARTDFFVQASTN